MSIKLPRMTTADMIASITQFVGREIIPLSPHKRIYIDPEALMLRHDARVAKEFEEWKRKHLE